MKKYISAKLCLSGLALLTVISGQTVSAADPAPKTDSEKIGYALGMNFGSNVKKLQEQLKSSGVTLDVDNFVKGLKDAVGGGTPALTPDEVRTILTGLQEKVQASQAKIASEEGPKNLKAGQDFLDKNKTQTGVVALPDGLQYKILKAGTGAKPGLSDNVSVNYRGTLINGDEFDASPAGTPISFPLTGVIKGWTEILQLMPVGSKWQVYIPSELAYGTRAAGPKITPNSTLVFEIELVSIVPTVAPAAPDMPK